jgi:hypothetical protein
MGVRASHWMYPVIAVIAGVAGGCGSGSSTTTSTSTSTAAAAAVVVQVTAPTSGAVINANSVMVRGTVSPPNATVEVQGHPAAVGNGVFTGSASLQSGKTTIDVIGSAPNNAPGSTSVVITRAGTGGTQTTVTTNGTTVTTVVTPSPTGGQTSCGGGLSVGPNTSCAFAANVQATYQSHGPGTFDVYSPVTGKMYSMTCNGGVQVVCTGGNNASVYFPG